MEDEIFAIFDKDMHPIGKATRTEAHQKGLWHQVIHVWIYDDDFLYFQQRSLQKKDYAGLYDITTAGHVDEAEEIIKAALRECHEEIGLSLEEAQLHFIGTMKEVVFQKNLIDKEIGYIYLCKYHNPPFEIGNEVAGMYKAYRRDVEKYALDKRKGLDVYDRNNHFCQHLQASQLCQHASPYYLYLLQHMR